MILRRYISRLRWTPVLLLGGLSACHKDNLRSSSPSTIVTPPLTVFVDNDANYGSFDTLLKKSGYYQRIAHTDSLFTLFIPDNAAFAAAGINIDSMLKLPDAALKAFVGYHILPGVFPTSAIPQTVDNPDTTLSGQVIYLSKPIIPTNQTYQPTILQDQKILHVNGIVLKSTDVAASNGVIDVLSLPLSLPAPSVQAYLQANPQYSLLVAALKKFNLYAQLDSAGPYTLFAPDNDAFLLNGIDSSRIASDTFDTKHYHSFLFSAGIVPGRIFQTDFSDAPVLFNGQGITATIYNQYGSIEFNNAYGTTLYNITAYDYYEQYGFYGYYYPIGPNPNYTVVNQPAVNGVIHGLDNIIVYPDSMYIAH